MPRVPKGINRATRKRLRVAPMIKVKEEIGLQLDAYLTEQVNMAIRKRDEIKPRVEKWRKTIRGERAKAAVRRGASNLSVPLLIWARTAVRARISESFLGSRPILTVDSLTSRQGDEDLSPQTVAGAISRLMQSEIFSSRALNGQIALERVIAELVDLGTGVLKVVPERDNVRRVAGPDGKPITIADRGRIRWKHIPFMDLIYTDGFGADVSEMPFIGHQFDLTWTKIRMNMEIGHYDKSIMDDVRSASKGGESRKPEALRDHDIVELYLDWDIDGDGVPESLVIDWHVKAHKRLRTNWNPFPNGRRPIVIAQFDLPANITKTQGQGVSEKLEGPQQEIDAVHNIAIESAKRAGAHVIALKDGSRAEEEFGGDDDMLPGDVIVTGNPKEDIVPVPLGDASQALGLIDLEEHTRLYVTRILGLDESRVGSVESGKRVTAAVGMATMKEGRMIIRAAINSLARAVEEATYLTLDMYKTRLPQETIQAVMTPEEARLLQATVFSVPEDTVRSSFVIRVNAQDAAVAQEQKKNELMTITQGVLPFYDRYLQIIQILNAPETPEPAKRALITLVERMERGLEAVLNTVESIPNPAELLVSVGEFRDQLAAGAGQEDTTDVGTLIGDLGALGGA